MTTLAPRMSPDAGGDRTTAHRDARARVFHLLRTLQADSGPPPGLIDEIIEEGLANDWPDVVKLGMLLDVLFMRDVERRSPDWPVASGAAHGLPGVIAGDRGDRQRMAVVAG